MVLVQQRPGNYFKLSPIMRLFLCLVILALPATTMASKFSEDEETMTQWKIEPFGIRLSPTPQELTDLDGNLRETIEQTLFDYLKQKVPSFEYILLADVKSSSWDGGKRSLQTGASTTVIFNGGVVSLKNKPTEEIDALVREAIETELLKKMGTQSQTILSSVRTVTYVNLSPTIAPTAPPIEKPAYIAGSTIEDHSADDPGLKTVGKVLGSILGCLMVLMGAFVLFSKPSSRHAASSLAEKEEKPVKEAETFVDEDDAMTDNGEGSFMAQYAPGELLDSVSVASEWTISTNDESKARSRQRLSSDMLVAQSEMFQRDRQITLQKNMLQSEWSNVPQSQIPPTQEWASGENAMSFERAHGGQGKKSV